MKYKIKNKTGAHIKYAKIIFKPFEEKILDLDSVYEHESFNIEELEKSEKLKNLKKGGK